MTTKDARLVLEPLLQARMAGLPGADRILNGRTTIAIATATVLAQDIARRNAAKALRDPDGFIDDLTDLQLDGAMNAVTAALGEYWSTRDLPTGGTVQARRLGRLGVGRTYFVLDERRVGLVEEADLLPPDGEEHDNLAMVLSIIRERLVPIHIDMAYDMSGVVFDRGRHGFRLRIPYRGGPGVWAMRDHTVHMNTMTKDKLREQITTIVDALVMTVSYAERTDPTTILCDRIARDEIAQANARGLRVRVSSVTVSGARPAYPSVNLLHNHAITLDVLDSALQPTTWTTWIDGGNTTIEQTLRSKIAAQLRIQWKRQKRLDALGDRSARVDVAAIAAIEAAGHDLAETLRNCSRTPQSILSFPGYTRRKLRLIWRDGVVQASFPLSDDITWEYGALVLRNRSLPETVMTSLARRPIGDVVRHDLLDGDRGIVSHTAKKTMHTLRLEAISVPFDRDTGILEEIA